MGGPPGGRGNGVRRLHAKGKGGAGGTPGGRGKGGKGKGKGKGGEKGKTKTWRGLSQENSSRWRRGPRSCSQQPSSHQEHN